MASFLVLAFAGTRSEMALRSVLYNPIQSGRAPTLAGPQQAERPAQDESNTGKKMSKLSIYKSKSEKVKMNYSPGHVSWSILMVNSYIYLHSS